MDKRTASLAGQDWSSQKLSVPRSQGDERRRGPFEWWYRLTAPPAVPSTGSLEEKELARRGRVTSTLGLLEIVIILVLAMPSAIAAHPLLVVILLVLLALMLVALVGFNRRGKLFTAGLLLVFGVGLSIPMSIVTTPGGLQPKTILLYDLLIQTDLLAVSVLPAASVFVTAFLNNVFILGDIALQPHSHNFDLLLGQAAGEVVGPPIVLHLLVAIVTFIWVSSTNRQVTRAERAEVIAALEHDLADRDRSIASQKELLDADIEQIELTHQQVANGNLNARVPIERISVLWSLAGKLNNLLTRFQRAQYIESEVFKLQPRLRQLSQLEAESQHTKTLVARQADNVRTAKTNRRPFFASPTGSVLDPLLAELHASYIAPAQEPDPTKRKIPDQRTNHGI